MLPWVSCNLEMVTGLGKYSSQPKRIGRDYKASKGSCASF